MERQIAVGAAAARLGERGFDVDELVRHVFQGMYVGEFMRLSLRVAFDLTRPDLENVVPEMLCRIGTQTLDRLGKPADRDSFSTYLRGASGNPELHALGRRAAGWISAADLCDLLRWNLPDDIGFESFPEVEVGSVDCASRWLADRFLQTYVGDWNTTSLHEEFRWSRGTQESPIAQDLMVLRRLPPTRLNAEIAQRAVDGEGRDPRSLLMAGVQHLKNDEHEQAVALFQGALAVADSQWVRNCLAFCLVPSDPNGAELMFKELLEEGFDDPLVHANMAATNRLLGDIETAHGHARTGLGLLSESDSRVAFLWGFEGGAPVLMQDVRLVEYLRFVLSWGGA